MTEITQADRERAEKFLSGMDHYSSDNIATLIAEAREAGERTIDEAMRDERWDKRWRLVCSYDAFGKLAYTVWLADYSALQGFESELIATGPTALAACRAALASVKEP